MSDYANQPRDRFAMAKWIIPEFNRGKVGAAGTSLIDPARISDRDDAFEVINNWRSSHGYPLQCLKMTLKMRAKRIDKRALIAQRLKRLSSISVKLRRNSHMKLSQMQDLGGCRAVVRRPGAVDRLVALYEHSTAKNPHARAELVKKYDYIQNPKPDGYRSVHLIYKYRTKSRKRAHYNGLRIEIQIRSRLQHAWATAVETVSIFTGQALKSNVGDASWKRFFALMGSAIALRERRPIVPGTPEDPQELVAELRLLSKQLKIETVLRGWRGAVQILGARKDAHAFLLITDSTNNSIQVKGFAQQDLAKATDEYLIVEKQFADNPGVQAVLVSVESLATLRSAYPNYYLDTSTFLRVVRQAIK